MTFFEALTADKFLVRDLLLVRRSLLTEQNALHEVNCPDCEELGRPCKKKYWLVLDIQETNYYIQQISKLLRDTYP